MKRTRKYKGGLTRAQGSRILNGNLNIAPINVIQLPEAMHAEPLKPLHATHLHNASFSSIGYRPTPDYSVHGVPKPVSLHPQSSEPSLFNRIKSTVGLRSSRKNRKNRHRKTKHRRN